MKKTTVLFLLLAGLIACGKKDMPIKKYYFPYANFIQPKVYQYEERKDTNAIMYWQFTTTVEGADTVLTTYIYNSKFKLSNIYQNIISAEGCTLTEMLVNMPARLDSSGGGDSTAMVKYAVKENEVFQWKVKPNQKLALAVAISNQDGSESEEVVTERSFEPKKEVKKFNGKEYECILAKDVTMFNHIRTNRTIGEEQQRNSYFAEGIGLIEFETFNHTGTSTYFTLKKIMTDEEWKKMLPTSHHRSDNWWNKTDFR